MGNRTLRNRTPELEVWRDFYTHQGYLNLPAVTKTRIQQGCTLSSHPGDLQNGLDVFRAKEARTQVNRSGFSNFPRAHQQRTDVPVIPVTTRNQRPTVSGQCMFPPLEDLSEGRQSLLKKLNVNWDLDERQPWVKVLTEKQKACFLNITGYLVWLDFSLDGLTLKDVAEGEKHSGVQEDQLVFDTESGKTLRPQFELHVQNRKKLGDKGFLYDKPGNDHQGLNEWGARQWVTRESMQFGVGKAGAFIDIDRFGPTTDLAGFFGHVFGEVIPHKIKKNKTDPFEVGKALRKRGVEISYVCK
ncbi:MAG: hypothetical protein K1Y36_01975 [Blastocatellia bacterium]|nr:hypothetical protein [Blastocatellia bacterium]